MLPPNSFIEILTPNVMAYGGGALVRGIEVMRVGPSMSSIGAPIKKRAHRALSSHVITEGIAGGQQGMN